MTTHRKIVFSVIFSFLLFLPQIVFAEDSLKIGGVFALTGVAAPFGKAELQGVELAVEQVNRKGGVKGRSIELLVEDSQSSAVGTVKAVTHLLTVKRVSMIIGPTWLDSFQGATPIAKANKAILITPSAVPAVFKKAGGEDSHVFSTFFDMQRELEFLIDQMALQKRMKVALLFDEDPFFQWVNTSLREYAKSKGFEIAEEIVVSVGTNDFMPSLTKVSEKGIDAILVGLIDGGSVVGFLKHRQQLIPNIPVFGIHDFDGYLADETLKGLFKNISFAVPVSPHVDFVKAYEARFKEKPKLSASNAYDALMILVETLEKGSEQYELLKEQLSKGSFNTVTFGPATFDALGGMDGGAFELKVVP